MRTLLVYSKVVTLVGQLFQIAGITIGAVWVLFNFIWVDGPSRVESLSPTLKLTSSRWSDDICAFDVSVSIKNGSRQTVNIATTGLRLWLYTPTPSASAVSLLDWKSVQLGDPIWELPQDQSRFNLTYEPGQGANYSYTVFVPNPEQYFVHGKLSVSSSSEQIASEMFAESTSAIAC